MPPALSERKENGKEELGEVLRDRRHACSIEGVCYRGVERRCRRDRGDERHVPYLDGQQTR